MFVTFIIGVNIEDITSYMNANPELILGQPILVPDVTKLEAIDQMDPHFIFLKTPAYWSSPNVNKTEEMMLQMKCENYVGPIYFVTVSGTIIPCMRFQLQMTSIPATEIEDWPREVEPEMCCQITLTTARGQKYIFYSGNITLKNFCGKNKTLFIDDPLTYTGGFS